MEIKGTGTMKTREVNERMVGEFLGITTQEHFGYLEK